MSSSTWVQLVRNFSCIVNTFLPDDSYLQNALFPSSTGPIAKATILECFIAVTQIAGVLLFIANGCIKIAESFRNSTRYKKYIATLDQYQLLTEAGTGPECLLFRQGVLAEVKKVNQTLFVGLCEFSVGVSFSFLALNSLHLHGPTHPKPLIDALIVLECCLCYFLYTMILSAAGSLSRAIRGGIFLCSVSADVTSGATVDVSTAVDNVSKREALKPRNLLSKAGVVGYAENLLEALWVLSPRYVNDGRGRLFGVAIIEQLQFRTSSRVPEAMMSDLKALRGLFDDLGKDRHRSSNTVTIDGSISSSSSHSDSESSSGSSGRRGVNTTGIATGTTTGINSTSTSKSARKNSSSTSNANNGTGDDARTGSPSTPSSSISSSVSSTVAAAAFHERKDFIQRVVIQHIIEDTTAAIMTCTFFLLNLVAGYGYLMGILAYYMPHEQCAPASHCQVLLMTLSADLSSEHAAWYGILAGDIAWTIEPLVAICAPGISALLSQHIVTPVVQSIVDAAINSTVAAASKRVAADRKGSPGTGTGTDNGNPSIAPSIHESFTYSSTGNSGMAGRKMMTRSKKNQ